MKLSLLKHMQKSLRGFTLIELLVVLGLFSSIMTIATGALYTTQAVNTKLQETQSILDNVNLSMEIMSRDIRYGSEFHCNSVMPPTTPPPLRHSCEYSSVASGTVLFFKSANALSSDDRVVYYLENGVIFKKEIPTVGSPVTYQITSNDVTIKSLSFYVTGAYSSIGDPLLDAGGHRDYDQPLITMTILGVTKPVKSSLVPVSFTVETSISSRGQDK
jgi:prepilin-type N-terminal cleavage/methylation domain-containing protein